MVSDPQSLRTTATRTDGGWVLNGEKWFVTAGDKADYLVDRAVAEGEQTLFFVDKDTPGLVLTRTPGYMHDPYIYAHPEYRLEGCRVPEANRIEGGGGEGAKKWFVVERLMIAARCCGAAERLIELSRGFSASRER